MIEKTRGIVLHQIKYTDSGISCTVVYKEIRKTIFSYQRDEKQKIRKT